MRLQHKKPLSIAIASIVSATLASGIAFAGEYGAKDHSDSMTGAETSNQASITPDMTPDDGWISISGSVSDVERDEFELNYGDGSVTVRMDDGDRDADAYALLPGDKVRVIGRVDDDFMESLTIDAHSVQIDKLDTTFYSSAADRSAMDENAMWMTVTAPITVSETFVNGTVKSVYDEHFTVETGMATLRVDVDDLPNNPLDDEGYLQVDVGDEVVVTGDMTSGFFEGRQLDADVVVELNS
ncbi:NirD/YgiW/YdeI family stress tolerance protein [Halomonas denitrificans]|nr:OB-fold nucleic acid binding domain-containing protein [Halomonas denitrificans]